MRDLNWIIASNGPEPTRRPEPQPVTDDRARSWLGYYGGILSRECMTMHPVELRDIVDNILQFRRRIK